MSALRERAWDWLTKREGSTRAAALIRLGLPLLIWSRWGREWILVRDLEPWKVALGFTMFVSTTTMFFGIFSRLSAAVAGFSTCMFVWYCGHTLNVESYTHHHTTALAIGTVLCALLPCGGSYSVDRFLAVRRARQAGEAPPPERGDNWALSLIALHVSAIYLWGTYAKLSRGYMSGERFEHYLAKLYLGSDYPEWWAYPYVALFLAWSAILIEPVLAIGLYSRRLQRWLVPLGLFFHGVIYYTMPVATFSATMWLFYIAFVDPDDTHWLIEQASSGGAD
jgi:hypothetical protein